MTTPRDVDYWAQPVDRLRIEGATRNPVNVEGRRLVGPMQGFGQMWQKTYRVEVPGEVTPAKLIAEWKEHYAEFWPSYQRFYAPVAGIQPGEIGLITGGHGPVKLSTGVFVIYSDEESFSFMNPEGHPFAGMITFSAYQKDDRTVAQVQLLIRANDPIMEFGLKLLRGHRSEDEMWQHTLRSLASHFGVEGDPQTELVLVDRKRVWRNFANVRYNAVIGTVLNALRLDRRFRKR